MSDQQLSEPTQWPQPGPYMQTPPKGSNGLAVAGFVLGLLGFLGSFIPVVNIGAIVLAVIGGVLAAVGLAKAKSARAGKGLAIAGLILSILAIVLALIIDVVLAGAVKTAVDQTTSTSVSTSGSKSHNHTGGTANGALGTTRDNPAPLGSAITGGDWTVRINSVKTVKEDSVGQTAAPGKTLLLINMTATYTGHKAQGDSSMATVKFVTADGRTIEDTDGSTMFMPNNEFDLMKTLYHGASETGNDILEVPAATWQKGVLAVSPDLLRDDTFVALK